MGLQGFGPTVSLFTIFLSGLLFHLISFTCSPVRLIIEYLIQSMSLIQPTHNQARDLTTLQPLLEL